ncbi:cytochrome d ubiquinol oxidase subunit II [Alkalimarinus coralli]|uniref:cytochrome d ubiquinol oxidase subunit II n=1 Tax=Alkalimarinus coralli TaxID=2935863 RepID=UPI00202AE968|nr:cytochrome d ubiquinol oxidase subunit II [Alkalimarinus coralli]
MDWAIVWLLILGFGVLMYVVLDGFSLGVGIISPWLGGEDQKGMAMRTLSHVWDSNQTWLVFGGVVLFVAFPQAYAVVLSKLYLPIMLMLIALIFRGVAFEFRFKADSSRRWWDLSFAFGCTLATLCQGLILGTLVQGIQVDPAIPVSWLTPFSALTALSLLAGYGLLGSCWLIRKSEGDLGSRARMLAKPLLAAVLVGLACVSLWTVINEPSVLNRWLSTPNIYFLAPIPLLTVGVAFALLRAIRKPEHHHLIPLLLATSLFVLSLIGLVVGMFPYIIPRDVTIWQAIAPDSTLSFSFIGVIIFLPVILLYNAYAYRVFSGKTNQADGY